MGDLSNNTLIPDELIGNSSEIARIRHSIASVARTDNHVTIMGEAGTEKLAAARQIFKNSPRSEQPLFAVKASRLNLGFEQEIWSVFSKQGERQDAEADSVEGTLILEDMENLNGESQTGMMALAQREPIRHFTAGNPVPTDLRIIATAMPIMQNNLTEGGYDMNLYLTLTSVIIKIPPLRDRKQDIPLLFDYFLKRMCEEVGREVPAVNFEVFSQLLKHDWRGNLQELENTVRTLVLSGDGNELEPDGLPFSVEKGHFSKLELQDIGSAVARLEKELISKALAKFAGNQSRAAQELCMSETNLRYKMKKLGITKKEFSFGR